MSYPKIFSENAILDWSVTKDYSTGEICRGGGVLYCSKLASGPSTTAGSKDPTNDDGTYWTRVSVDDEGNVHKSGREVIDGAKDFKQRLVVSPPDVPYIWLNAKYIDRNTNWPFTNGFQGGVMCTDKNDSWLFGHIIWGDTASGVVEFDEKLCVADSQDYSLNFRYNATSDIQFHPFPDNTIKLGTPSRRWTQLYAASTTISTSDQRLKDTISLVPDNVLDAWSEIDFVQYQMKDSLQEKGSAARFHSGLIAQSIDQAFSKHNLDASRYGLFCYDEWDAEPERLDENGGRIREAQPAGNQYSLRYEEALCMEAAYQRRQNSRTESRFLDLEQRIALLEEKIKQEEK